jgi:hypothetical protein
MCSIGFLLSSKLGVKKSIMFFIAVEIFLILWIKDSLVINIIMLISPIDALKISQAHSLLLEIVNLQNVGGKDKIYQVKQVIALIEKYNLAINLSV